ncbi:MAG: hypothetical protein JO270_09600 [Acidobacteriaceae bacterium]|nr:hypothetical protein [Acidobacteriaceae bacterium]MBV8572650.1 hypothetical protein [Acidobacteriaceae bacterium]
MKRNQWAAALLSALLFLSGVAVGALGHRYYAGTTVSAKTTAEDFRQRYLAEMQSKLRLTGTQVKQLEAILDDTKAKYKAVRDQYHPQMLAIKKEQISRVKSILTDEQIPIYERLVAEHERHAREQEARDRREEQKREAARDQGK